MAEVGILSDDDRVELLEGEIIEMTPIGSQHAACVARLTQELSQRIGMTAILYGGKTRYGSTNTRSLSLILPCCALARTSMPQLIPDWKMCYSFIEAADRTAQLDRAIKLPLYAKAGIKASH